MALQVAKSNPAFTKLTLLTVLVFPFYGTLSKAALLRIDGTAQYDLINYLDGSKRPVAIAELTILVDGPRYTISTKPMSGGATVPTGFEGRAEEYGCDGIDTFLVTDRTTIANRGKGPCGIIFPGRFPNKCSALVQTAWLGYCSDGYFKDQAHSTNLDLSYMLPWVSAKNVTNLVEYWPNSQLPKMITGWSGSLVKVHGREDVLKQYPNGFKDWRFTAEDETQVSEGVSVPRRLVLEGFVPRPPKDATTGEETAIIRRITFLATSVKAETSFVPLPVIPIQDMPVLDKRFQAQIGSDVQITHVSPTNGWPTHASSAYKELAGEAAELQRYNMHNIPQPLRTAIIIAVFCVGNLIIFGYVFKRLRTTAARPTKQTEQT